MLWFGLLRAPFLLLWVCVAKRKEGFRYFCLNWKRSFLIFVLSYLAYGIVLWAMTVAPIGLVSALRETSVIFAALIGILIFKETAGPKRIVAAILVCIGTALIKM
jgi:drug/metabolite transporter (DMT)-like permease